MDSLHLVDPALRPLLDMSPTVTVTQDNLSEVRARMFLFEVTDDCGVTLTQATVPGPDGAPDIALYIYRPNDAAGQLPCIYHVHGGGYIGGAAKDLEAIHRPLSAELGCMIVSVEYRLAPETVFPGAIEDCYAGLAWTVANADKLGIDLSRMGVMGESAGGGLAAALALLVRDRGEYMFAFQHLMYPMIDDRTCTLADPHPHAGEFIWNAASNHFGWSSLLGREPGGDDVSPYAAAARATDLAGLPQTFIMTGALDLFLEENMEYARRLMRAGVPAEFHVYPGCFHAFDAAPGNAVSDAARRDSRAALGRFMAARP